MSDLHDSNILIDYLKGFEAAEVELSRTPERYISIVTWMEVMSGPGADPDETRKFLLNFEVLPLTDEIAEKASAIRRESRLKLLDAIILATARVSGRILVTRNTNDFPSGMAGVRIPYQLNV